MFIGPGVPLKAKKKYRGHRGNASIILESSNACPFRWKTGKFICTGCPLTFPDFSSMREHAKQHPKMALRLAKTNTKIKINVADLRCNLCQADMPSFNRFKDHLASEHGIKLDPNFSDGVVPYILKDKGCLPCVVCEETFELFSTLNKHMNKHEASNICFQCGKSFLEPQRLQWHLLTHGNPTKSYPCSYCSDVFKSRTAKNNHVAQAHRTKNSHKCPYCEETFDAYRSRLRHMTDVHGKKVEYVCHLCPATFAMFNLRTRHIAQVHTRVKKFNCCMCSMGFSTSSEMKRHMVKHTGQREFECEVCHKAYARKKTLREHMKIHNNIKNYACQFCNSAFVQNCSLKNHIKTHHSKPEVDDKSVIPNVM